MCFILIIASIRYTTTYFAKEGTLDEQEGQGQCKAYPECENDPGPDGLCDIHREPYYREHSDEAPPGWQHSSAKMTVARLNALGAKVFLTGASEVVSRKILGDANATHLAARDNGGH